MGGIGSGRLWRYDSGCTTDTYRSIDVRRWARDGLLKPGCDFTWRWLRDDEEVAAIRASVADDEVRLSYRFRQSGDDWRDMRYPVWLDRTPCHLGGERAWFLCPANNCMRRVAILYGSAAFVCRRCLRLTYPSQRETASDRAMRRADAIRERLGWPAGTGNGHGPKPMGMHRRTFERLVAEHDAFVAESWRGALARFGDAWPEGFW